MSCSLSACCVGRLSIGTHSDDASARKSCHRSQPSCHLLTATYHRPDCSRQMLLSHQSTARNWVRCPEHLPSALATGTKLLLRAGWTGRVRSTVWSTRAVCHLVSVPCVARVLYDKEHRTCRRRDLRAWAIQRNSAPLSWWSSQEVCSIPTRTEWREKPATNCEKSRLQTNDNAYHKDNSSHNAGMIFVGQKSTLRHARIAVINLQTRRE